MYTYIRFIYTSRYIVCIDIPGLYIHGDIHYIYLQKQMFIHMDPPTPEHGLGMGGMAPLVKGAYTVRGL